MIPIFHPTLFLFVFFFSAFLTVLQAQPCHFESLNLGDENIIQQINGFGSSFLLPEGKAYGCFETQRNTIGKLMGAIFFRTSAFEVEINQIVVGSDYSFREVVHQLLEELINTMKKAAKRHMFMNVMKTFLDLQAILIYFRFVKEDHTNASFVKMFRILGYFSVIEAPTPARPNFHALGFFTSPESTVAGKIFYIHHLAYNIHIDDLLVDKNFDFRRTAVQLIDHLVQRVISDDYQKGLVLKKSQSKHDQKAVTMQFKDNSNPEVVVSVDVLTSDNHAVALHQSCGFHILHKLKKVKDMEVKNYYLMQIMIKKKDLSKNYYYAIMD